MKRVLMLASVASMIGQFNIPNIELLQKLGCDIDVACNFKDNSIWSEEKIQELKIKLKRMGVRYYQIDFSRNITNISSNLKALSKVQKLMKKNEYLFVHCHSPIGGVVGRIAGKLSKTKVIYTAHGFHFFKGAPLKNWLIYYPVEKILSYMTEMIITINREDYNLAKKKMKARNVEYIPGVGVDLKKFKRFDVDKVKIRESIGCSNKDIVLISVGEVNENKNHEIIIRALSKVSDYNVKYWICGIGNKKSDLEILVNELHLQGRVFFLGFQTDVFKFLIASDIFCFPSKREGLGLAAIEAMSVGLPLITSNIHGINDYSVSGLSGYSCEPDKVDEFVNAIKKLCYDEEMRHRMGKHNIISVEKYDLTKVMPTMESIYKKMLE